jgi:hypothetical protein
LAALHPTQKKTNHMKSPLPDAPAASLTSHMRLPLGLAACTSKCIRFPDATLLSHISLSRHTKTSEESLRETPPSRSHALTARKISHAVCIHQPTIFQTPLVCPLRRGAKSARAEPRLCCLMALSSAFPAVLTGSGLAACHFHLDRVFLIGDAIRRRRPAPCEPLDGLLAWRVPSLTYRECGEYAQATMFNPSRGR